MQVIFHTGAHHTDDERLLKCLLNNKQDFSQRGIAVPGPGKYRTLLKDAFGALDEAQPSEDARDVLVDAILDDEKANRLILSNANFFGSPRFALGDGQLYPQATLRLHQLTQLFSGDRIEIFMAIRNPATFVPNVLGKANEQQRENILADNPPRYLRWSELLRRIRNELPELSLTVWCHEDIPLIWGQIIRDMAGLAEGEQIIGAFDILRDIMSKEGMRRFRAYLNEHPATSERKKRQVMTAFLDKYADLEAMEEELDLEGWTEALVSELTALYDVDVAEIRTIPGVRLIEP